MSHPADAFTPVLSASWHDVVVGALPLVGVVLGALAAGWVTWLSARRAEEAAVRQARRRVAVELGRLAQDIGAILRTGRLNVIEGMFETHVWRDEEKTLARDVTDKEWEVLAVVYENIEGLRQLLASNLGVTLPRDVQARLGRTLVGLQDERRILGAEPVPVQLPE